VPHVVLRPDFLGWESNAMGLAERDYYRSDKASAARAGRGVSHTGGRSVRGVFGSLSVTTWLIIVCAAVFLLDRTVLLRFKTLVPTGESRILQPDLDAEASRIPRADRVSSRPQQVFTSIDPKSTASKAVDPRSTAARGRAEADAGPTTVPVPGLFEIQTGIRRNGEVIPYRTDLYRETPFLQAWLQFTTAQALMYPSATRGLEGFEFWRFFGYQFLHADVMHLGLNMLGLYFFGPIVESFLGRKRYLAFFLLCGLFGAFLFMLLNAGGIASSYIFPGGAIRPFLPNSPFTSLIGASASVYGVILAAAFLAPNETIYVMFVVPMRLKHFAYLVIGISVVMVVTRLNNPGGEAAHLGGAIAGAWFIRRPHHLHGFFDLLGRVDPTSRSSRARRAQRKGSILDEAEIDRILAKIRTQGMGSLSERERTALRDASRS